MNDDASPYDDAVRVSVANAALALVSLERWNSPYNASRDVAFAIAGAWGDAKQAQAFREHIENALALIKENS